MSFTVVTMPPSLTTNPADFELAAEANLTSLHQFSEEMNEFAAELESVGAISPNYDTVPAMATTTDLWNSSFVQSWIGSVTITDFPNAASAGAYRHVRLPDGITISNNGNISVQDNGNYTSSDGDWITVLAITVATFEVIIHPKVKKAGYRAGVGGSIIQSGSKSSAVTLNKLSGMIQADNASLAANTRVSFTLNNTFIADTDCLLVNVKNGFSGYNVEAKPFNGGAVITLWNITGSTLAESLQINFAVIKGAIA